MNNTKHCYGNEVNEIGWAGHVACTGQMLSEKSSWEATSLNAVDPGDKLWRKLGVYEEDGPSPRQCLMQDIGAGGFETRR